MSSPHFVESSEIHVKALLAAHPVDRAMELAVGGEYDLMGERLADLVISIGLKAGQSIIDLGCGSGRLATKLGERFGSSIDYLGIDVVQDMLDYAAGRTPVSYRYVLSSELRFPAPDASADMILAFSVFTHLMHEETYRYLRDALRVLRPGGLIVFSFLEFSKHWSLFEERISNAEHARTGGLDMFIERTMIDTWTAHLGLVPQYDVGQSLGQSAVILRRASA